MLAILIGKEKETLSNEEYLKLIKELSLIPDKISEVLQKNSQIAEMSKTFTYASNCIYLGRGYNFPVALEGALKLKETSYIHAEGYPAAEMKHGPIALISNEMPVIAIATQSDTYEKRNQQHTGDQSPKRQDYFHSHRGRRSCQKTLIVQHRSP